MKKMVAQLRSSGALNRVILLVGAILFCQSVLVLVLCNDLSVLQNYHDLTDENRHANQGGRKSWFQQLSTRAQDEVDDTFKPHRDYLKLFGRYRNWQKNYRAIYDDNLARQGPKLPEPLDLLAAQFAEIDHELQEEIASYSKASSNDDDVTARVGGKDNIMSLSTTTLTQRRSARRGADDQQQQDEIDQQQQQQLVPLLEGASSSETMDYVYDVLERMISRLELLDLNDVNGLSSYLASKPHLKHGQTREEIMASEQFQAAMERMKQIGKNTAVSVMQNEAMIILQTVVSQVIASTLLGGLPTVGNPMVQGTLSYMLDGWANVPFTLQYVTNLHARAVMGVTKTLNPLSWFQSAMKTNQQLKGARKTKSERR